MFAKVQQVRLNYCKFNQKMLRVELYSGLSGAVSAGDINPGQFGRRLILPYSFIRGPKYMFELYQDCMSIVRQYGKPDYFIAFTCNPDCEKITSALMNNKKLTGRPDLIVRVFVIKFREFIDDICVKHVLGRPKVYAYTIEFQKLGFPHAHILVILTEEDKPRDPSDYDKFVCAEISNPSTSPKLYKIVKRCMMWSIKETASCMRDGKCSKQFLKAFAKFTNKDKDSYPVYKRTAKVCGFELDNRWVVSYNLTFLLKFNAHIYVEISSRVKAVKYLYKYLKGHDRVIVEFHAGESSASS
ncbi:hypothetical protein LOD99_7451 [Oopsacas minuta]|uniref:Helitron helicase-like domain-containing protein n=1 Tax=Oopsacas minuta TaxID=111878 RepID=A0AAV7JUG1_9METZ|nr:hypothetical protein LOD99_7451 [Oopsacas minuta]